MSSMPEDSVRKLVLDNSKFLPEVVALINEGHLVTITARGNSMRPFIEDCRDCLVFGKADNVAVGDVILAEVTDGHYVCHRIESIEGDMVVMRGDGNVPNKRIGWNGTETFSRDRIRAKLVQVKRLGKTYILATSRTWKVYSAVWTRLLPVRRYLLGLYRLLWLRQMPNRIKKIFKN